MFWGIIRLGSVLCVTYDVGGRMIWSSIRECMFQHSHGMRMCYVQYRLFIVHRKHCPTLLTANTFKVWPCLHAPMTSYIALASMYMCTVQHCIVCVSLNADVMY